MSEYTKANLFNRILAKLIDILIALSLTVVAVPFGMVGGILYILIADGFMEGKSPGKKLIGLKVVILNNGEKPDFKASIIRNVPFGLTVFLSIIPGLGYILLFTAGLAIIGYETYLLTFDEKGLRLGDNLAGTIVIDDKSS